VAVDNLILEEKAMPSERDATTRLWKVYQLLSDVARMPEPEVDSGEMNRTIIDLRTMTVTTLPPDK
jgi:hypothetical protein